MIANGYARGGGIAICVDIGIVRNTISGNTAQGTQAGIGGGVDEVQYLENNLITDNRAISPTTGGGSGGGAALVFKSCRGNRIFRNHASFGGGGVCACWGSCIDNVIAANTTSGYGAGIWQCEGVCAGNTIAYNSAGIAGGAVRAASSTFVNCIVWGNSSPSDLLSCSTYPSHSCVQNYGGPTKDDITTDRAS